ncbi:lysozyme inhibitor LprI family protein [Pseudomonas nitroreducens]|uniref:lysozyme inhibitor LprI family protein n=1 Tax=Pseudomonas nitroreducens TaxID=46680 RepID=UPI00351D0D3D
MKLMLLPLGLLAASFAAQAADCANPMDQATFNACAAQEYSAADKRLNQVYNDYRQRLDARQKDGLKDAQQAWLRYRDLHCRFAASSVEGGSAYGMVFDGCLAEVTDARVKELKSLSSCEEGDFDCPAPKP